MQVKIYYRLDTLEIFYIHFMDDGDIDDKKFFERFGGKVFEAGKVDFDLCRVFLLENEEAIKVLKQGYGFRFTSPDLEWETFEPDAMTEQKESQKEQVKVQLYSNLVQLEATATAMKEDQRDTTLIDKMISDIQSKINAIYGEESK